ncbi:hypothetical protein [Flavobacterium sp.]|uniref:hypothetical protein n=1 Tax=Flavobacterium sp. TaxID=239 RepID=UPI0025DBCB04|nr:hypothetical protein [Flavobacterium sp.]
MEAILHYRTSGHIGTQSATEEIIRLLAKQNSTNLIDVRPYEYELDNQCDYSDANPSPEHYVNFYVITEIGKSNSIEKDVSSQLSSIRNSNLVITQEWECGNEQYYVVQLAAVA